jgi:hypothetical protein
MGGSGGFLPFRYYQSCGSVFCPPNASFLKKFEKSNGQPSRPQETTKSARQVTDPPGAMENNMKFIYTV